MGRSLEQDVARIPWFDAFVGGSHAVCTLHVCNCAKHSANEPRQTPPLGPDWFGNDQDLPDLVKPFI